MNPSAAKAGLRLPSGAGRACLCCRRREGDPGTYYLKPYQCRGSGHHSGDTTEQLRNGRSSKPVLDNLPFVRARGKGSSRRPSQRTPPERTCCPAYAGPLAVNRSRSRHPGGNGARHGFPSGFTEVYLVDPASSICLSQRLSHACLSTNGLYSETAKGSSNQLWFL